MIHHGADATGIANIAMDGTVLDTWYPAPRLTSSPMHPTGTTRLGAHHISPKLLNLVRIDEDRRVEQIAVHTTIADLFPSYRRSRRLPPAASALPPHCSAA